MSCIKYKSHQFKPVTQNIINQANVIIAEYENAGYELTLRQLYYQFVSRNLIPNTERSYKQLGGIINDGRLAGLIDWQSIVDRTRNLEQNSHWETPGQIIRACASQYQIDKWQGQKSQPEIWVEKEALIGVIEPVARGLDVPYFACRGYVSQSECWSAGMRFIGYRNNKSREPVIIYLGDHDPSGLDMTRDIEDRMAMFTREDVEVKRIALTMEQIEEYNPPPNPAKITDSRAFNYIQEYGHDSWELDALNPKVISDLIIRTVAEYRDDKLWNRQKNKEKSDRKKLEKVAKNL